MSWGTKRMRVLDKRRPIKEKKGEASREGLDYLSIPPTMLLFDHLILPSAVAK